MASNDFVISTDLIVLGGVDFPGGIDSSGSILANNASGFAVLDEGSSSTNPTLIPRRSDLTTGIGGTDGEGTPFLHLVTDGANRMSISAAAVTFTLTDRIQLNASLRINGLQDQTQLRVAGHSTQTTDLVVWEQNDGDDLLTFSNVGLLTMPLANSAIVLGPNASATGDIRFGNTRFIAWRNNANNADLQALSVDENDILNIGISTLSSVRVLNTLTIGPPTTAQLILPLSNDANTPTLAFGDGDSGFYETGDDTIHLALIGQQRVRWNSTSMRSLTAGGWELPYAATSATQPMLRPQDDTDTGYGSAAADQLSLIAGGAEVVRISGTGVDFVQVRHQGSFTSDGSSTLATKFLFDGGLIGAAGDITSLFGADFNATITTQTATESITDIAQVRIDEPSIADNLTGLITHASILLLTSSTVLEEGVNNWGIRALGAAPSVFQAAQFIIGRTTVDDWLGVIIGGQFTSGGGNTLAARVRTEGGMTGAPGDTSLLAGMWLDVSVATQIATETIGSISQLRIDEPAIADNLTGGGLITNAQTLEITGSPTEGVNNYALRSLGPAPTLFAGLQFVIGTTVVLDRIQFQLAGSFTSGGSGVNSQSFALTSTLIGASGDTGSLASAFFDGNITTQTATENIADVSQVRIEEPNITDNLTGDVTTAHTLFLVGSPTEGVSNFVLRATGAAPTMFQGLQFVIGDFNVDDFDQVHIGGTFTSGGASTTASKFVLDGTIIGASGDTVSLNGALLAARITTQTETENISDISGVHIVQPNITDNLTGNIDRAHTLLLNGSPTQGVANFVLRANGAAPTMFQGLQFVIGDFAVDDFWQVNISGAFISGGTSTEAAKLRIEGSVTGADGDTAGLVGTYFDTTFVTQTAVENIADISQCRFDGANITDNLTGDITNAQTLFITASPTAGENNWTIRSTAIAPSIFQGVQFAIGRSTLEDWHQFVISGGFVSGGSATEADMFKIESTLIGAPGDSTLIGAFFAANITTQTATETIADIAQVKIFEPTITDNLTGDITRAQTLLLNGSPTEGLTNFALRSTGPARSMFVGLPFTIGTNIATDVWQVQIRGNFTSGGTSNRAAKFEIEESVIGVSGDTVFLGGALFAARVTTQTVAEVVTDVFQVRLEEPVITVGAGSSITNAQTLLIVAAPTEGVNNYALRVAAGATLLGGEFEHTGSTFGIFSTTPATQPAAYTRNAVAVEDRTLLASASATTLNNNNVLAALIADLQSLGVIG